MVTSPPFSFRGALVTVGRLASVLGAGWAGVLGEKRNSRDGRNDGIL